WLALDANNLIYNFYQGQGRQTEADTYFARAQTCYQRLQWLDQQAQHVTTHDRFEPHGLDDVARTRLQERLAKTRGLRAAYLVRKVLEESEWVYVLAVGGQAGTSPGAILAALAAEINLGKPVVFVSLNLKP